MKNNKNHFFYLVLFFLTIGFTACKKNADTTYTVLVLQDGLPIKDQFVGIRDLRFGGGSVAEGQTNQNGTAILDIGDWVISDDMEANMVVLTVDKKGCGYTIFDLSQRDYSINVSTEETVTIEVLSPDLNNQKFTPNTEIPIKMQLHSNLLPFKAKISSVSALNGKVNSELYKNESLDNYDSFELQELMDRDGIVEFSYFTTEGENGFWIRYHNNVHGESASPLEFFEIKME